ncbi:MAG: methyltransferase domain-containing protein, partial [Lachnospiraceae bacterium]|nr:methyltransferase domain-containing protein [Lachnospiraceae bacterium]
MNSVTTEERFPDGLQRADEEINDLLRRGYRILQKKSGFRFGIDAVLLAWFAGKVKDSDRVIDLGTGTGVIPLLMDARNGRGQYIGLEIDPVMTEMASRSALMNGCADRVRFSEGDLQNASERVGKGTFDIVTSNPPYWKAGTGKLSPDPMKAAARHEVLCT